MSDLIRRQVVLDKIEEVCFSKEQKWVDFRVSQGSNGQRDLIIKFIESLPSIQPKPSISENPNKSKTVLYTGDGYADGYMVYDKAECPNCGYEYEEDDKDWGMPFCSSCGQALKWESEESE